MVSRTLLGALAGVASASMVIPYHHAVRHIVEARQTDDPAWSRCTDALASVLTDVPKQPFDVTAYDACGPMPTTLLPAFSSYVKAMSSWHDIHSSALTSALALCPTGPISEIHPTCTLTEFLNSEATTTTSTTDIEITGSGSSFTVNSSSGPASISSSGPAPASTSNLGSSGSGSNNTANADTNAGKNAGRRDTGLAWAAGAIAGFLGLVAVL